MILRYDFATDYIEPICGTGERTYSGDDGPAALATINLPSSTAFDPLGRMYISDQENQRIRMVDIDGTIHTVVGTGEPGFSGDGGPADQARIYAPIGQAAPPTSRIATRRIRQPLHRRHPSTTASARLTTQPASSPPSPVVAPSLPCPAASTTKGPRPSDVSLYWPCDVGTDSEGRVFFADTFNHCVRYIDLDGALYTVAGQCGKSGDMGDGGPPAGRPTQPPLRH